MASPHEAYRVPDLFLFPCPVAMAMAEFVYLGCQGNVYHDPYCVGTLAITSVRGRGIMNRKLSVLFFVVAIGFPVYMRAQSASGIIAPSRMVDWSIAGVEGGIPKRTTICATLSPGVTASDISNAISSCSSGGVVFLNAGTYNLSGGISFRKSNVTLRGAGPDKTFLVFTGGGSGTCNRSASICVGAGVSWQNPPNLTNWTGGYSQGSTQVTLSSVNNLKVGGIIIFDQLDDSSDTGNIYFGTAYDTKGGGSGNVDRPGRSEVQVSVVQAINGNTVTIAPGIYMPNWRASQSPQAYWPSNTSTGAGVEDLSIDNTNSTASSAVAFGGAVNSWETNVRSMNISRDHVWLWYVAHITVSSSYFYGTQRGETSEYGVEIDACSASLFTNNIFQHVFEPYTLGQGSGNVISYSYTTDNWYSTSTNWMRAGLFPHDDGTSMNLFEGNETSGLQADNVWGAKSMNTFFRNRLLGWDDAWGNPTSGYQNTIPVNIEGYNRYFNVIGNVLGEPGFHTNYEDVAPSGTNANKSIYVLGWTGEAGRGNADPVAISTLMRWGNYDTATNSAHWDSSEVPSGISLYANPVPSSQTLPASFYLSSKPGWWGTPWGNPPWPGIGPDVTGGSGPGGHSYDIPAKLCYENTSKGSNGILNFNADSCYSSSPAPAPPSGLSVTAH